MKNIIKGAIIGVSNIIPGVSGGTMAVILGVYDKIILSISNIKKDFKNSMKFLVPIGIGGVLGILTFTKIIGYLLENFPIATNLVFVGLVLGSIPMIFSKTLFKGRFEFKNLITMMIFITLMMFMENFTFLDESKIITDISFKTAIVIFVGAMISASAMIIPGISGSFIMLILGVYTTITNAISTFNIEILCVFGAGALIGVLLCSKLISLLFEKFERQTYSGILGLMIGSLYIILPSMNFTIETSVGLVFALVFGVISYKFTK